MKRFFFSLLSVLLLCSLTTQAQLMPDEKDLPTKKSIDVFSQRIAYYDIGHGPALVLVHGLGGQARFDFGNSLLPLAKHYRVIALDQIGFGESDKPQIDYSIQTYVDFLGEFLNILGIKDFSLGGESLGGWIVAKYTIESLAPENHGPHALPVPHKLIIIDAAGLDPINGAVKPTIAGSLDEMQFLKYIIYDKNQMNDEFLRSYWALKLKLNDGYTIKTIVANPRLDKELVNNDLGKISIPSLVLWGADDKLLIPEKGRIYAAGIPGAKLVLVPECGHVPAAEQPEKFVTAVEEFLKTK